MRGSLRRSGRLRRGQHRRHAEPAGGRARGTGSGKIIFASTGGAIYGEPAELPATEACPPDPLDPYGASKLAGEPFLDTYRHNYGLEFCVLRYGNVYGPRQDPHGEAGVVAIFAGAAGRPARDHQRRRAAEPRFRLRRRHRPRQPAGARAGSGIYNIGTGVPTDINTIFGELARLTGVAAAERHGPAKPGEVRHTYLDAGRARRELGWTAQVTLGEGLARTVAFFKG